MRVNPDQRNQSLRCDYHRDHGHETNHCQGLKFLVERLIRTRHLRRFIREPARGTETALVADRTIAAIEHPSESQPTINFVLGGLIDDQYWSKRQRKKNSTGSLSQSPSEHHQYPRAQRFSQSMASYPFLL